MAAVATKADLERIPGDVDAVGTRVDGLEKRVVLVEAGLTSLSNKVGAKLISGGQVFAIIGGPMAMFLVSTGALVGLPHHLGWLG